MSQRYLDPSPPWVSFIYESTGHPIFSKQPPRPLPIGIHSPLILEAFNPNLTRTIDGIWPSQRTPQSKPQRGGVKKDPETDYRSKGSSRHTSIPGVSELMIGQASGLASNLREGHGPATLALLASPPPADPGQPSQALQRRQGKDRLR